MIQLQCKLTEYVILYTAKLMWGLDCDIEALHQEIMKLEHYKQVKESLESPNDCTDLIPTELIQKIDSYIALLNRKRNKNCRNCT